MELKDSPRLIVDQRREIFPSSHKTFKGTSENSKIRSCDKGVWDGFIGNTNRQCLVLVHPLELALLQLPQLALHADRVNSMKFACETKILLYGLQ